MSDATQPPDLSQLTPAPWVVLHDAESGSLYIPDALESPMVLVENKTNAQHIAALQFVALARNAFDVMLHRGWGAHRCGHGWNVAGILALLPEQRAFVEWCWGNDKYFPDPFAALVEADQWYRQNIEKGESP